MSTKKRPVKQKNIKSFLELIELKSKMSSCAIYSALNWDRRRYHAQKIRGSFPMEHLEELRDAVKLSADDFYSVVINYLNKK